MAILAAFIIALLVSLLFAPGYRRNGSLVPLVILFFVLFAAGIASQLWITPFGPDYRGVYWLPNIFFVMLLAFLFLAPSYYPNRRTRVSAQTDGQAEATTSPSVVISAFIWIVLLGLLVAIFVGYSRNPERFGWDPRPQTPAEQTSPTVSGDVLP